MSVACCDPQKEPNPQEPNLFTCPGRVWVKVSITVPSLLVPSTVPDGRIYSYPVRQPSGAPINTQRYSPEMGISPLLPTAGEWMVYSDSLSSLDIVVMDARDESTVSTYQKTGFTVPNHFTIATAAGPASTVALAANIQRKYAILVNDSANPIYLNFAGPAVVNTGIRLNAAGGSFEMMPGNVWRGAINMISAVASDVLLVTEGV
jgi:hypothetical protein